LNLLTKAGAEFDIMSGGEWFRAEKEKLLTTEVIPQ